jgi:hypothetical protein
MQSVHAQLMPYATTTGVDEVLHSLATAVSTRTHAGLLIAAAGNARP